MEKLQREDFLTPVHKGLRSIIYDTGKHLQTNDFADRAATDALCLQLDYNFRTASSACMLCWLSSHASDENDFVFSQMKSREPELIETLLREHEIIEKKLDEITSASQSLKATEDLERRNEMGRELNLRANDLFAYYITHMNKEEAMLIPSLEKHFTNEQLHEVRSAIMRRAPPDRMAIMLGYIVNSLNMNELTEFVSGLKKEMPPPAFEGVAKLIEHSIGSERWAIVGTRMNS